MILKAGNTEFTAEYLNSFFKFSRICITISPSGRTVTSLVSYDFYQLHTQLVSGGWPESKRCIGVLLEKLHVVDSLVDIGFGTVDERVERELDVDVWAELDETDAVLVFSEVEAADNARGELLYELEIGFDASGRVDQKSYVSIFTSWEAKTKTNHVLPTLAAYISIIIIILVIITEGGLNGKHFFLRDHVDSYVSECQITKRNCFRFTCG